LRRPDEFIRGGDDTWPGSRQFPSLDTSSLAGKSATRTASASAQPASSEPPKRPSEPANASNGGLPPTLEHVAPGPLDDAKARALFGDYVTNVWWPTWSAQHPDSAYNIGKRLEKRILPAFGNLSFAALDADRIGPWKAELLADGLRPSTVNAYLSLLGAILKPRSTATTCPTPHSCERAAPAGSPPPRTCPFGAGRSGSPAANWTPLAAAISPCYRALVLAAALTGMRWGELAGLRWDDIGLDRP